MPTNNQPIEIFDGRGRISLDDSVYETLDPDRKERFLELKIAVEAEASAEAELKAATAAVAGAASALQASQRDLIKLHPPMTAVEAARQWIKTQHEENR